MLPLRAADHYPKLLADKDGFKKTFENDYEDPLVELEDWREYYAKQFGGNSELEDYLRNIDAIVAFERMIRDPNALTMDNLIQVHKFLGSTDVLENIAIPFP